MPPLAIVAAVGAAASIGGAAISAHSSNSAATKAANAATANTNANNALAREVRSSNEAHFAPYEATGLNAMGNINSLLAGDQSAFDQFRNSTNYQFQLNEGLRGVNQGFAGIGALNSGAAMKGLNNYAQGQAGNALGGYYNMLRDQQNLGFGSAQALAGVANNYLGNVTANNNNAADATGNAALLRGQNNANFYGGVSGALGTLAGSFGSSFNKGGGGGGGYNDPSLKWALPFGGS